jgi:glycine cleavage system transcriptional repressor
MEHDSRVSELAITVIGHDRPGLIADVTEVLAGLGMNLTDSTMTRLRGHFAMTLVCAGTPQVPDVEAALAAVADGRTVLATVREVEADSEPEQVGGHFVVSVHGADRLGIVAAVTRGIAEFGGNITDLTTRLAGSLYVVMAEFDLPPGTDDDMVRQRLEGAGRAVGVDVSMRPAETDVL